MTDPADSSTDALNQHHLDQGPDELARALRIAYPPTPEDEGEADRFRWLIQALALEAIGKVIGAKG